jgi:hypothetical protein
MTKRSSVSSFTVIEVDGSVELLLCKFCHKQFLVDKTTGENFGVDNPCGCCEPTAYCPNCSYGTFEELSCYGTGSNLKCYHCQHEFYSDDYTNSGMQMCGCCGPYPYCPKCCAGSC